MLRWMRVAIAVCLTLVLGASTFVGEYLLKPSMAFAPGALLVMLVFAYGWPRLTDSPQPRATSIMLAVFGGAGVVATVLAEEGPFLEWLPILVGMGLLWAFVQNLTRGLGASREQCVYFVQLRIAGGRGSTRRLISPMTFVDMKSCA